MRKLIILFVLPLFILSCNGNGFEAVKLINDKINECYQYSVDLYSSNICTDVQSERIIISKEEHQRLYDLVSNELPIQCLSITVFPEDGSQPIQGYIKEINGLRRTTLNDGSCD